MAVISKRSRGSVNDMLAAMKDALGDQSVEQSTVAAASDADLDYIAQVEQYIAMQIPVAEIFIVGRPYGSIHLNTFHTVKFRAKTQARSKPFAHGYIESDFATVIKRAFT